MTWSMDLGISRTGCTMPHYSTSHTQHHYRREYLPPHHQPLQQYALGGNHLPACPPQQPPGEGTSPQKPPVEGTPPHQSEFSLTGPHLQLSPIHKCSPVMALSGPPSNTLPHSSLKKPACRRAVTVPYFVNPPIDIAEATTYPSSLSQEEQDGDSEDNRSALGALSAFRTVRMSTDSKSNPCQVEANSIALHAPDKCSGSSSDTTSTASLEEHSLGPGPPLLHESVSLDRTHYSYNQLSRMEMLNILSNISSPDCPIQKLEYVLP